jgi:hypothetical protein
MATEAKAACVHCRTDIVVPDRYAHGDHITCGACRTRHKVSRGDVLRLVLADVAPVQEQLEANRQLVSRLEAELQAARGSFGIGSIGFGVAVVYILWQVALKEQPWSVGLLVKGIVIAILSGAALEVANYLFLAKRQTMLRIAAEIEEARSEGARLRQLLRDSSRV